MKTVRPENMTQRERKARLAAYIDSQRGRPPIKPAPRAAAAVGRIVRPLSKKFGPGTSGLAAHWIEIAGPRYGKLSRPIRLQGGKDGSTLIVAAKGPAATLITADAARIIAAANSYLGQGQIMRLKVVQGQIGGPAPQKAAASARAPKQKTKIAPAAQKYTKRGLTPGEENSLQKGLETVNSGGLRQALETLGRGVISRGYNGDKD